MGMHARPLFPSVPEMVFNQSLTFQNTMMFNRFTFIAVQSI